MMFFLNRPFLCGVSRLAMVERQEHYRSGRFWRRLKRCKIHWQRSKLTPALTVRLIFSISKSSILWI